MLNMMLTPTLASSYIVLSPN